jgi:hypothetical protein
MRRWFVAGALLAVVFGIDWGVKADNPPPRRFARYVDHAAVEPKIDDLASVLHIERYRGKVELTSGFRSCKLVLAAYKDGKPVDLPDAATDLGAEAEMSSTLTYAVQVVNLDYLPLGGGKKGDCRLRFALKHPDGATSAVERDVPKSLIDLTKCSNMGFTERAATDNEAPLFWLKVGGTIPGGPDVATKDQAVAEYAKDGSVLIVSLRFNDRDAGK